MYDSNGNAYNHGGLSAREQQLVKETAEALVRQFVHRPSQREPVSSSMISTQPTIQSSKDLVQPNYNTVARQTYVPKVTSNAVHAPNLGHVQQDQEVEQRSLDASIVDADIDEQGT
jgi:hypothetical protein